MKVGLNLNYRIKPFALLNKTNSIAKQTTYDSFELREQNNINFKADLKKTLTQEGKKLKHIANNALKKSFDMEIHADKMIDVGYRIQDEASAIKEDSCHIFVQAESLLKNIDNTKTKYFVQDNVVFAQEYKEIPQDFQGFFARKNNSNTQIKKIAVNDHQMSVYVDEQGIDSCYVFEQKSGRLLEYSRDIKEKEDTYCANEHYVFFGQANFNVIKTYYSDYKKSKDGIVEAQQKFEFLKDGEVLTYEEDFQARENKFEKSALKYMYDASSIAKCSLNEKFDVIDGFSADEEFTYRENGELISYSKNYNEGFLGNLFSKIYILFDDDSQIQNIYKGYSIIAGNETIAAEKVYTYQDDKLNNCYIGYEQNGKDEVYCTKIKLD